MTMNIAQLQSQLQHVPDQTLIGYVQRPNGQVPSYLALAELTRRKEIRSAGTQQAQPAKPSVAQQMIQESQKEPGVAGLPLREGMFNEQTMAGGGIIAFADGGNVIGGTGVTPDYNYYNAPPGSPDVQAQIEAGLALAVKNTIKKQQAGLPLTLDEQKLLKSRGFINTGLNTPTASTPQFLPEDKPKAIGPQISSPAKTDLSNVPTPPRASAPTPSGIGALAAPAEAAPQGYDLPTLNAAKLDVPQGLSTLDALNQRRAAMAQAGVDNTFYDTQKQENETEREKLKADKENAGWMALARAGLGMAGGKSQSGLANLAEGATAGLDQFGRDAKEIKQDEKLLRQADKKLEEAKYMQDRGDADAAYNAMQKREDLINSTNIKNKELEQQANITKAQLEGDRSKTMFTQAEETKRHKETVRAQLKAAGAPSGTERVIDNIWESLKKNNPKATYIDAFNQYNANKGTAGLDDDKVLASWNDAGGLKGTKMTFPEYKASLLGKSNKYDAWGQLQTH